ncbi:metal-dependent hydrolase [uncultured Methanolobus sp.]|uniref:metal-dependent hydrolase n=1 Tax=uncultured Methanolobus sp. TaxID=218300 RepID=UPI002AAA9156|nr:metal-dependent hydrolase [uncultured Methanolobus sp.]
MFIFGHLGITLGIFNLIRKYPAFSKIDLNIPLIAFGAMLPDIIDKPLGKVMLANSLANGRIYGHTLLFFFLVLITAYYFYKKNNNANLLIIPAASFMHLIEDRMWMTPQTLFWPLLGWQFPDGYQSAGILDYFLSIFKNAYTPTMSFVFMSEMIGLSIMIIALVNRELVPYFKKYRKRN